MELELLAKSVGKLLMETTHVDIWRVEGMVVVPVGNGTLLFKFYEEWGGIDFCLPRDLAF